MSLSCIRDEKLAVAALYQPYEQSNIVEIWITIKTDPNAVSWSQFLKVNMTLLNGFPGKSRDKFDARSFFIDEEKKFAVVSLKVI